MEEEEEGVAAEVVGVEVEVVEAVMDGDGAAEVVEVEEEVEVGAGDGEEGVVAIINGDAVAIQTEEEALTIKCIEREFTQRTTR